MEITHKQMEHVFELVQNASTATLKYLTPAERKAVKIMLESLQHGDDFLMLKGFQIKDLKRLKEKLGIHMAASQKKQVFKGLSKLIGKTVSVATLSHTIDRTKTALTQQKKVEEAISTKKSEIASRIAEHEAIKPLLKEIRTFFHEISSESYGADLKKKMREKREVLEGKVQELEVSQDPDRTVKLSTLKGAISCLQQLEKTSAENWDPLISVISGGWGGERPMGPANIERERQEIEKLSRHKIKREPHFFFKHRPKRSS